MNYEIYKFSFMEIVKEISIYILGCLAVAYIFYRSVVVFMILIPGGILYFRFRKKYYVRKRKKRLLNEFAEMLYLVASNIRAGYSMENAFSESYKDILLFYGTESLIASELMQIKRGMNMNQNIESLFRDFATRSNEEDILLFAEVLEMAKRNGGNIPEVFSDTADRVREKICTDKEIDLLISEKKLELRIMEAVPFLIPMYLEITSGGYFEPLYEGITGRCIMSGCLVVYVFSVLVAERVMKINV